MSIHVCKCQHNTHIEYHLRYPGMKNDEAQFLADKINSGGYGEPKREWVGLTDKEKQIICEANNVYHDGLIEDIEAKLKEKNI